MSDTVSGNSGRALVIVPTYNERANIERLVNAVLAQDPRLDVLVVDDGSPDGTGDIVRRISAETAGRVDLLQRERKLGLGTAYIAGFGVALRRNYDYVFEMDADFSHPADRLGDFLRAIERADVVVGSRYLDGKVTVANWPISRLLLSYFANVYARAVTGVPIWDLTGGFKCFRSAVLRKIDLQSVKSNGYAFQIEMNVRVWNRKFRIVEVPILFEDRTEGQSKMSRQIMWEAIWMVWRLRWWAITGRI